jgi:tetratricopeptide (TPR) repeat protein
MTIWKGALAAALVGVGAWLAARVDIHAGAAAQTAEAGVTLRMIVVGTADAADRLLERIKAGESFALLARTESTAPSAEAGGWLGRLPLSQLRPDVRAAVQALAPGQVTEVIRLPTGFAIFKREQDEDEKNVAAVTGALAASGAVKYVLEVSGFGEMRLQLDVDSKPDAWFANLRNVCEARIDGIKTGRQRVEAFLSPDNAAAQASRSPLDLMELHHGLAQLAAYDGRMDDSIAHFEQAYELARQADNVDSMLQMEEALGVAHLHKAEMDNDVQARPGELCLLQDWPKGRLPKADEAEKAISYFQQYLARKPDEREVWWLLNLAYMRTGGYPQKVPPAFLIPPSAFQAGADRVGRFTDVAHQVGLDSVSSAGGAVVDDFTGSGRDDVIVSSMDHCVPMKMFRNNGDGTFSDRSQEAGLADQFGGLNVIHADYNNDGCPDLLVLRGGWENLPQRKSLLKNDCHGHFTDVTEAAGLATVRTSTQTAVWTDIDNDGWLDLFVGAEGTPAQLFHNQHDGTFVDIAHQAGVDRVAFTKSVAAMDYDNDRYPDLYVSNYGGRNFLYHNNRNGTFTEMADAARVPGAGQNFVSWFFDYDNDGWQDLLVVSYVTSVDEMVRDYLGTPHNAMPLRLYHNQGDGSFRDVSASMGFNRMYMPMGSNFGDIDNDGWLDVFLGTGHPSYASTVGAVLLRNREGKGFDDVTASAGTGELHKGHGVAFDDLDNDGDEDIVFEVGGATPGDRHAMRLFENPGNGNSWLSLKLTGTKSNRSAIGARITVTAPDGQGGTRRIYRAVTSGGSFGDSPLRQHIGLGPSKGPLDVDIWWPTSNTRQRFTRVAVNQWLDVEEGAKDYRTVRRERVTLGARK